MTAEPLIHRRLELPKPTLNVTHPPRDLLVIPLHLIPQTIEMLPEDRQFL